MTEGAQEFLENVAKRCREEPVTIAVRQLMRHWGHGVRNEAAVEEIRAALAAHGLTTDPGLYDAGPAVAIMPLPQESAAEAGEVQAEQAEAAVDDEAPVRVSLCVRELPSATGGLASVRLADSLAHAETTMLSEDYSQLAVVQDGQLRGAITWDSIVIAKARGKNTVRAALDPYPEVLKAGDDLLRHASRIWGSGFAFVEEGGEPVGIVTLADLAQQFVDLAHPFVVLSEIEQRLRRVIRKICTVEEMRKKAHYPKKTNGADDLMFGDYKKIFEDPGLFGRCDWGGIDQKAFVDKIGQVGRIRNKIMHFSPEAGRDEHTHTLTAFLKFIKGLDGSPS